MIVYLAIIQFALVLVQPPEILAPFTNAEACLIEADKLNHEHADELWANGAGFVCLQAVYPYN